MPRRVSCLHAERRANCCILGLQLGPVAVIAPPKGIRFAHAIQAAFRTWHRWSWQLAISVHLATEPVGQLDQMRRQGTRIEICKTCPAPCQRIKAIPLRLHRQSKQVLLARAAAPCSCMQMLPKPRVSMQCALCPS